MGLKKSVNIISERKMVGQQAWTQMSPPSPV